MSILKFTPDPKLQDTAKASAHEACDFVRDQFRVTLDWSDESIQDVERALDAFHRLGPTARPAEEQVTAFARMFGSYVGEVYRRNHGAVWGMVERNGWRSPGLKARSFDTIFWPIERAYSRIAQGSENNISVYYSELIRRSAKPPPPIPIQPSAPKRPLPPKPPAPPANSTPSEISRLSRHFVGHGLAALALAVFSLFSVSGFDWGALFIFGVPTLAALAHARLRKSRVAEAFLVSIGIASLIALVPGLFPRMGVDPKTMTATHDSRLRNLYLCIYLLWFLAVLPVCVFGGNLRAKWRGEVPRISMFTCYLGAFTICLFWAGVLLTPNKLFRLIGLWPVF